jgi:hypothetical protein
MAEYLVDWAGGGDFTTRAAARAGVSNGSTLRYTAGTYYLTGTTDIRSNILEIVHVPGATVIFDCSGSVGDGLIFYTGNTLDASDIPHGGTGGTGRFIVFGAPSYGIRGNGANRTVTLRRVWSHSHGLSGLDRTAAGSVIDRCAFSDNGQRGISSATQAITVTATDLWGNAWEGILASASGTVCRRVSAYGNNSARSGLAQISIGTTGTTAEECIANGGGVDGILAHTTIRCMGYDNTGSQIVSTVNTAPIAGDAGFVDGPNGDLRITIGSPAYHAGQVSAVLVDHNGIPYHSSTPSVGAHELVPFHLLSLAPESSRTIRARFSAAVDADTVGASAWSFSLRDGVSAVPLAIDSATSGDNVLLTVVPDLTPGGLYTGLAALAASEVGAEDADPDEADFSVPVTYAAEPTAQSTGPILAALTSSMGDLFGELAGPPVTLTIRDFAPDDDVILVETTLPVVAPGAFWLEGIRHTFTGKTDAALMGVVSEVPRVETVPTGSEVIIDQRAVPVGFESSAPGAVSVLEQLRRDQLIHMADGARLDELARIHRFPRPSVIERSSWREALRAVVHGPRGLPGSIKGFLRAALRQWDVVVEVTREPSNPQRITATAGAGTFLQAHVGRNVLIGGEVYRIAGPADLSATGAGEYVTLSKLPTPLWAAADWAATGTGDTAEARILPFLIEDRTQGPRTTMDVTARPDDACLVRVRLFIDVETPPPTYMVDAGDARAGDEPYGGHVLADAFEAGDQTTGPFPIYLGGDPSWEELALLLKKLVAPGIRVDVVVEVDA